MKYSVSGADKNTGDERTLIISATDEKDAEQQARQMGLLVSAVIERGEFSGSPAKPISSGTTHASPSRQKQSTSRLGPKLISYNQGLYLFCLC